MVHASLSQDRFQRKGFWEVGRLYWAGQKVCSGFSITSILQAGVSSLLVAPPEFSRLVFSGCTMFLIGTSCCETTHARCYYCTWPRREVSVNVSLTGLFFSAGRESRPWFYSWLCLEPPEWYPLGLHPPAPRPLDYKMRRWLDHL